MSLKDEIAEAFEEVGFELSTGPLTLSFVRPNEEETPWDSEIPESFPSIVAFDKGQKNKAPLGKTEEISMRMFSLEARGSYVPKINDSTMIDGREYKIASVEHFAPVGENLSFKVGLID